MIALTQRMKLYYYVQMVTFQNEENDVIQK